MGKKILALIVMVMCCAVMFSACGTDWKVAKVDYSGEVSNNGGFLVEKGNYVYFINGIEDYTASNAHGKVVKASLARMAKSGLANPAEATVDVLVPKLITAGDYKSGIYVYGDYVYYATPTSIKDKTGTVQNEYLDFQKTKLDGTGTTIIERVKGNATEYRYAQVDGKVYLVYVESVTTGGESSTTEKFLKVVDEAGKEVYASEAISSYMFGDAEDGEVYFTKTAYNEELENDEKFNDVYKLVLGTEAKKVLAGAGSYREDGTAGALGVTYTLLKKTGSTLYYSYTYVDTSTGTNKVYKAVDSTALKVTETAEDLATNLQAGEVLSYGAKATTVFAATSVYVNTETILYIDSTYGLMKYNYKKASDPATDFGIERLYCDDVITGATISMYKDGFLYVYDSNNYYYRLNVQALLEGEEAELVQLTYVASDTAWYAPEVVGEYFVVNYSATNYTDYLYVSNLDVDAYVAQLYAEDLEGLTGEAYDEKFEEVKDEYVALLQGSELESVQAVKGMLLGKYNSADQKAFDKLVEDLTSEEA